MLVVFNEPAATEIYTDGHTLSLHDALPICSVSTSAGRKERGSTATTTSPAFRAGVLSPSTLSTIPFSSTPWPSNFSVTPSSCALQRLNYTLRQPLGVVASISPWNLPLYLFTWKLARALAAGTPVVATPSEITPMSAPMLGERAAKNGDRKSDV